MRGRLFHNKNGERVRFVGGSLLRKGGKVKRKVGGKEQFTFSREKGREGKEIIKKIF
jgi:hypothetical protein